MLLRAGSDMPYIDQERPGSSDTTWWFHYIDMSSRWGLTPYHEGNYRKLTSYFMKIFMSGTPGVGPGTFATYEKAHRARLAKTFVRLSA